jgi:biopolymer transport protein ExbB
MALAWVLAVPSMGQQTVPTAKDSTELVKSDTLAVVADSAMAAIDAELSEADALGAEEGGGLHKQLKRKFIEGSAGFMSLVALALVLGLAFCIERLIYLTLAEINAHKLMADIDAKLEQGDVEGAKDICRDTRGPVASICYQGLLHIKEPLEQIDRQLTNYGAVLVSGMEKGCSWIRLFITVAPSLGFLGTVIGMVMAFDRIQTAGDISPTIVAEGMKVALITTIFGIIVAIVLQFFYSYIISKIDRLTAQMEESAVTLTDSIAKYKDGFTHKK